jgi:AbiV family abortive infection protein
VTDLGVLGGFAITAARNSRRLLDDAELLATHGRYPSAYSAAVLAFEEAGKAWMAVMAMSASDTLRAEFPFRELITDHENKLLAAFAMARMFQRMRAGQSIAVGFLSDEDLPRLAREHHQIKLRGFYADVRDGMVWDPVSIGKNEARQMIASVRRLDEGNIVADPDFISFLISSPEDLRSAMDGYFGILLAGVDHSPEKTVADLQAWMDQLGATPDELRQMMLDSDASRAAAARAAPPNRVQPRRRSRARRH